MDVQSAIVMFPVYVLQPTNVGIWCNVDTRQGSVTLNLTGVEVRLIVLKSTQVEVQMWNTSLYNTQSHVACGKGPMCHPDLTISMSTPCTPLPLRFRDALQSLNISSFSESCLTDCLVGKRNIKSNL